MKKIVLIALLGLTILISSASAIIESKETIREITLDHWSETRKIEANEYLVYKFAGIGTNMIEVSIEVVSGDSIDMILLNSGDFTEYQSMMQSGRARQFNSYSTGKGMNLRYMSYSFEIPANDTYYIVEDNTPLPNNGGQPGGSVLVEMKFTKSRCLKCEDAAREVQKRAEEADLQSQEAQRKLNEEMNKSKEPKSTPGFGTISLALVLTALYLSSRKN